MAGTFIRRKDGSFQQVPPGQKGTHHLPPAPPAFARIPSLIITWPETKAKKPKPKPKPKS